MQSQKTHTSQISSPILSLKRPREAVLSIDCNFAIPRLKHGLDCTFTGLAAKRPEAPLGQLQKLFGPLTRVLVDNPTCRAGAFPCSTLQGSQSHQPTLRALRLRFCQPVALWWPPVSQGLPFNMLLVPNNCRRSFLCMEFFFLERETLVCFSTYLCTQGLISLCAPTRY